MEYYTLDLGSNLLMKETEKARQIRVTCGDSTQHDVWFPKSQCRMKTNTQMEVPEWILSNIESKLPGPIRGIK